MSAYPACNFGGTTQVHKDDSESNNEHDSRSESKRRVFVTYSHKSQILLTWTMVAVIAT